MKLSTRGRYATRALLDLALHGGGGPVSLREVSERQAISAKYLDQILTQLRRAGFIRASRGSRGGFQITADPESLTLLDIMNAVEGRMAILDCVVDPSRCDRAADCITREVWSEVTVAMERVLRNTTLADLIRRARERHSHASG